MTPDEVKVNAEQMQNQLAHLKGLVAEWSKKATIEADLAIFVAVLGIVIGVCQKADRGWSRMTTIALGLIVSAVTITTNILFDADYKTYRRGARRSESILLSADSFVQTYVLPNQKDVDRLNEQAKFLEKCDEFNELSKNVEGDPNACDMTVAAVISDGSVVYAQSQLAPPDWTRTNGIIDSSGTYFVGMDDDKSAAVAESISRSNAYINAANSLAKFHKVSSTDVTAFNQLIEL